MDSENFLNKTEEFITGIYSLYKMHFLYPATHPRFENSLEEVFSMLNELLEERNELTFIIVDREFIFDGNPLFRRLPMMREFAAVFESLRIDRLTVSRGVDRKELSTFIALICTSPEELADQENMEEIREKHQLDHVLMERVSTESDLTDIISEAAGEDSTFGVLPSSIRGKYADLYENVDSIFGSLSSGDRVDLTILQKQIQQTVKDFYESMEDFVEAFHVHRSTFGDMDHDVNVCALTTAFCRYLGFTEERAVDMAMAGLLHDIGKSSLPEEIQKKPRGALTPEEARMYRRHVLDGVERLLTLENAPPLSVIVCYEHHAGFDRKGFPVLMGSRKPHPAAFLVNMVQRYEKIVRLASESRKPMDYLDELRPERGHEFDPNIFDLFEAFLKQTA